MAAIDRLLGAAALLTAATATAQTSAEQGQIALRYLDYQDSQPEAERIRVQAPSVQISLPLANRWNFGATWVHDTISGASPLFHTRVLKPMNDTRRAGEVSLGRGFENSALTLTVGDSKESDYHSQGLALSGTWSTEDRNRTVSWGLGRNWDAIRPAQGTALSARKQGLDLSVGVTQVLSPHSWMQISLGHNRVQGYLSDPYKLYDVRPDQRRATRVLVRRHDHWGAMEASSRVSYRYYRDSFGIRAHTLSWELEKTIAPGWSLTPILRVHQQSAARFYVEVDPEAAPFATQPPEGWTYSSLDQRLSAFGALTGGLKLGWQVGRDWFTDLKFEHYEQRGSWHLGGTGSQHLAPWRAVSWQWGLTRAF